MDPQRDQQFTIPLRFYFFFAQTKIQHYYTKYNLRDEQLFKNALSSGWTLFSPTGDNVL